MCVCMCVYRIYMHICLDLPCVYDNFIEFVGIPCSAAYNKIVFAQVGGIFVYMCFCTPIYKLQLLNLVWGLLETWVILSASAFA